MGLQLEGVETLFVKAEPDGPTDLGGLQSPFGHVPAGLNRRYVFNSLGTASSTIDVSADGQRFLMIKNPAVDQEAATPQIVVVQNWFEELKELVPVP